MDNASENKILTQTYPGKDREMSTMVGRQPDIDKVTRLVCTVCKKSGGKEVSRSGTVVGGQRSKSHAHNFSKKKRKKFFFIGNSCQG